MRSATISPIGRTRAFRGWTTSWWTVPPSLGLLTVNALVAAREVLIPIQAEYYALEGLSLLLSNIDLIRQHLNPELVVSSILITMFDARTRLAAQVAEDVREHFPPSRPSRSRSRGRCGSRRRPATGRQC